MNFKFVRKGIVITAFACATLIPAQQIVATEKPIIAGITDTVKKGEIDSVGLVNAIAEIQKQENTQKTLKIETPEEIKFNEMVKGNSFVMVAEDAALVMESTVEGSASVGKVYRDSVVKITERKEAWCKIETGNVVGYVQTEHLITGKDAVAHVKAILTEVYPETDILTLTKEEIEEAFSVGETVEEEAARLAAEEAAREAAAKAAAEKAAREEAAKNNKDNTPTNNTGDKETGRNTNTNTGGKLGWPVNKSIKYISSYYGWRSYYYRGRKVTDFHMGIDIPAAVGTDIYAAEGGTVVLSQWHYSYGNYMIVDHGGGVSTLYAHCSKLLKKVGAKVSKGDHIAEMGSTGSSTGSHLHFEVRVNGKHTNPLSGGWIVQPK